MSHLVFTYGTLMFPEVLNAVCGQPFPSEPARLSGYRLTALHDREYPGIIPSVEHSCEGVLYQEITDQLLAVLDEFEGDEYQRLLVTLSCAGRTRQAWTYVIRESFYDLVAGADWNPSVFREKHLSDYLASIWA